MNAKQLRAFVIKPTLQATKLWSQAAEDLLCETACQESHCGEYIRQLNCTGYVGAFGIYQMELATARDIYDNYLAYHTGLKKLVEEIRGPNMSITDALMLNLAYATIMARIHYLRDPKPIPTTREGRAEYWKRVYNTKFGKGKPEEYLANAAKYDK